MGAYRLRLQSQRTPGGRGSWEVLGLPLFVLTYWAVVSVVRLALGGLIAAPALGQTLGEFRSLGPGGGGAIIAAVFHNTNPQILLVGQDIGGIAKSADGGRSWRHVNAGGLSLPEATNDVYWIWTLVAHPTQNHVFFAGTGFGLFRSDDTGETWTPVLVSPSADPYGLSVPALAFDPQDPDRALAGTEGAGLWRSTDGGRTFAEAPARGLPEPDTIIKAIAFDPLDGSAYLATDRGLFRTPDLGETVSRVSGPFRHEDVHWVGTGLDPQTQQTVLWVVLEVRGDAEDPAAWAGGIYRRDGSGWTEVRSVPKVHPDGLLLRPAGARLHPRDPRVLFIDLITDDFVGGLFRYDARTDGWEELTAGFVNETWSAAYFAVAPRGLAISPSDPDVMVSTNELGVLKTTDGGRTWAQLATRRVGPDRWAGTGAEVTDAYDLAASRGVLYAAFEDIGLWRSDDRGASWKQLLWLTGDALEGTDAVSEVRVHPQDPDRLYAGATSWSNDLRELTRGSRLFKSVDGGRTWRDVTPPGGGAGRPAVAVAWGASPEEDVVYVAFHGGSVYKSSDGGTSWRRIASGFQAGDDALVFKLAVHPDDPDVVYAGLMRDRTGQWGGPFGAGTGTGSGLYRTTNGGTRWERVPYPEEEIALIAFAGRPRRLFVGGWTYDEATGMARGALRASDDGTNFVPVLEQPFVTALVEVPGASRPGTGALYAAASSMYAAGEGQRAGLYLSEDNGTTWRRVEGQLLHNGIWDLALFPDEPDRVWMATRGDGVVTARVRGAPQGVDDGNGGNGDGDGGGGGGDGTEVPPPFLVVRDVARCLPSLLGFRLLVVRNLDRPVVVEDVRPAPGSDWVDLTILRGRGQRVSTQGLLVVLARGACAGTDLSLDLIFEDGTVFPMGLGKPPSGAVLAERPTLGVVPGSLPLLRLRLPERLRVGGHGRWEMDVTVYDLAGRERLRARTAALGRGLEKQLVIPLRDPQGRPLAHGVYLVTVSVRGDVQGEGAGRVVWKGLRKLVVIRHP